jgi:anaerobic magnesium-protoporphyrin IX monomethyl ester cyclase
MKTVLIRPSNRSGSLYLNKMGFLPIPLGLVQLASSIRAVQGNSVSILDMEADGLTVEEAVEKTSAMHPDMVGITVHATAAYNNARQIMNGLKELDPGLIVIVGGHHATFLPEQILNDGFDIVALGEGDRTVAEIVQKIDSNESLEGVAGIAFRKEGRFIRTRPRQLISSLDELPLPAFDLIDREKYRFLTFGRNETVACVETSRGCPYGCDFCSVTPTWGFRRRNKSNARIIEEMELAEKFGYNWIFFTDDIFLLPQNLKERMELFENIKEHGIKIQWIAQMRADAIARNPEFIPPAVEAGLRVAALGVESGSREVLKKMRKRIRQSDTEKAVSELDRNGVITLLSFMMGAPYERIRDMMSTVRLGFKLAGRGADVAQFTIYTPLPGTEVFREAVEHNRLFTLDWDRFDFFTPVMKTRVNPVVIQLFQYLGLYSFYIRRFLIGTGESESMSWPKRDLLPSAITYMLSEMPEFIRDVLSIPSQLAKTYSLFAALSGNRPNKEEADMLIRDYDIPVYLDGRRGRVTGHTAMPITEGTVNGTGIKTGISSQTAGNFTAVEEGIGQKAIARVKT